MAALETLPDQHEVGFHEAAQKMMAELTGEHKAPDGICVFGAEKRERMKKMRKGRKGVNKS